MIDVYLTIDTECSMGGAWGTADRRPVGPELAVLGRRGRDAYGIPLVMDILEAHGLRGTFFVEVLAGTVVGEPALADAYGDILKRGHDAQLHLHPVFYYYGQVQRGRLSRDRLPDRMDLIGALPVETQRELLQEGVAVFKRLLGRPPVAFRAGNYAANRDTLRILRDLGIAYDSSFNSAYLDTSCLITERAPTNSAWQDGSLWEIPLTVFLTGRGRYTGLKPLDVGAVSFPEIRSVLEQADAMGMNFVNVILHSFSLFKKADAQFSQIRKDRLVTRRFRKVCEFLAAQPGRFRVRTFGDLPQPRPDAGAIGFPRMGAWRPALRRLLQGINRAYWI
jgi:hypothetical protein